MGKVIGLVLAILIINIALYLFPYKCVETDPCEKSSLINFVLEPFKVKDVAFLAYFYGVLAVLGGAAILVGVYYVRSEYVIYAAASAALLITLMSTVGNLYQFINSFTFLGTEGSRDIMAMLFTAPISVYTLFVLFDWARGKD